MEQWDPSTVGSLVTSTGSCGTVPLGATYVIGALRPSGSSAAACFAIHSATKWEQCGARLRDGTVRDWRGATRGAQGGD